MNHLLKEAEAPIREALERLVEKDERRHPFVIVEKVGRKDLFVQFATHESELLFDVPLVGIRLEPMTPTEGAKRAVEIMTFRFCVRQDERVLIREEEDKRRGRTFTFLERLLAWGH